MKNNKKNEVLVFGNFNVVHPGHLRLFSFAKKFSENLVVGVFDNAIGGERCIIDEKLRLEAVSQINLVSAAVLINCSVIDFLKIRRPAFVVMGKEHEDETSDIKNAVQAYGGEVIYGSGEFTLSSTELLKNEFLHDNARKFNVPQSYLNNHQVDNRNVSIFIENFKNIRVLVVGDLIVDEYIECVPLGMSQEDPTIVVNPVDHRMYLGGAGIVAAHGAGLGAAVSFITVAGDDNAGTFAMEELRASSVKAYLEPDLSRPTTLKKRYRANGKTLLRVSELSQVSISPEIQNIIYDRVASIIDDIDVLIFSDFNYGCLPQRLVDSIISLVSSRGIIMVADSQASSQISDITRFTKMDLITPTEREARLALRNTSDGLVVLADQLAEKSDARNVFLKLGSDGVIINSYHETKNTWHTDRLPAFNLMPADVAGAGDSMLIASALALAAGANIWEAGLVGSIAAAIQVARVGNKPLSKSDLLKEFHP